MSASRPIKPAKVCLPQTSTDSGEESGVSLRGPPFWWLLQMNSGPALPFPPPASPPPQKRERKEQLCSAKCTFHNVCAHRWQQQFWADDSSLRAVCRGSPPRPLLLGGPASSQVTQACRFVPLGQPR